MRDGWDVRPHRSDAHPDTIGDAINKTHPYSDPDRLTHTDIHPDHGERDTIAYAITTTRPLTKHDYARADAILDVIDARIAAANDQPDPVEDTIDPTDELRDAVAYCYDDPDLYPNCFGHLLSAAEDFLAALDDTAGR